jgi:hypothetical protein
MNTSAVIDYFASVLLAPSILIVFGVNIRTWKQGQPQPLTFNMMVKDDLDEFFNKLNKYYLYETNQGVRWDTIEGHYWLELHMEQSRRVPSSTFASEKFKE